MSAFYVSHVEYASRRALY